MIVIFIASVGLSYVCMSHTGNASKLVNLGSCGFTDSSFLRSTFIPWLQGLLTLTLEIPAWKTSHKHAIRGFCIEAMTNEALLLMAADQMLLAERNLLAPARSLVCDLLTIFDIGIFMFRRKKRKWKTERRRMKCGRRRRTAELVRKTWRNEKKGRRQKWKKRKRSRRKRKQAW